MTNNKIFLWFRGDLRLTDNPALVEAAGAGPVLPVFIDDRDQGEKWALGGASKWWLHHSLTALDDSLKPYGGKLHLYRGDPQELLPRICEQEEITHVFWNRRYDPNGIALDKSLKATLKDSGYEVTSFSGNLLREPWAVLKKDGTPYQVYTPYWRASLKVPTQKPIKFDVSKASFITDVASDTCTIESLNLLPKIPWDKRFYEHWKPGEVHARQRLKYFLKKNITLYNDMRDIPGKDQTSGLSPHLRFGEVTARQIWQAVTSKFGEVEAIKDNNVLTFLKEIVWREFAYQMLYHAPHTAEDPLRPEFKKFPWKNDEAGLKAWQKGLTGYPIVDAGMRQLYGTGWMHNRVRMIVASFLVKDLIIPWQEGAAWFWDTLVDADLASNTLGWQWAAGCGADAAPYFRIFNPTLQGEKFDPDGVYVKRWVPELAKVPAKWLHKVWEAPASTLQAAGVSLGRDYPLPIVDHKAAKVKALFAYDHIKKRKGGA